jgi:hypothetical protein
MVCESLGAAGLRHAARPSSSFYALKVALLTSAAWVMFCGLQPGARRPRRASPRGALHPIAFQKAIVWSLLFEVLGLGCGSGPLTGRYLPTHRGLPPLPAPGDHEAAAVAWRLPVHRRATPARRARRRCSTWACVVACVPSR